MDSMFPLSGSRTILIVDDNPVDRDTYRTYLCEHKDCDFTFFEAEDADEALRICRSVHLDCILLDYELPDVDGLEFIERIRIENALVRPPVVMITGRGSENVAVEAMKRGAMDYIVKSETNPANLLRAILNAIDRSESSERLERERRDRQETEEELRKSEERFRLLVEGVRDYAIIMMDTTGHVISWNSGARRLLNYHDREILGQHIRVLFTPEDIAEKIPEKELELARTTGASNDDRWHVKNGGERFWASGMVSAVYDELDALRGFAKVLRDMTEKKIAENRLKDALAARDEFLSIASHELKTPITALKFNLQAILRKINLNGLVDLAYLEEALTKSDQQASRLATLVRDLLDVSRLNADRLKLNVESVSLHQLVLDQLDRHQHLFEKNGMTYSLQLEEGLSVKADIVRLEQVLANLFTNAVKYAPRNPITVRLRRNVAGQADLSVQDQGPGIPAVQQQRIFERFERATSASEVSGLGLGLYISRKIVEALNGTLSVHSIEGRGSTFSIKLPLAESTQ